LTAPTSERVLLLIKDFPGPIIHGDADLEVFYSLSPRRRSALQSSGTINKLVTIPGANHDLNMSGSATPTVVLKEISDWVGNYGK